jgi:hypothetical protein
VFWEALAGLLYIQGVLTVVIVVTVVIVATAVTVWPLRGMVRSRQMI